MAISLIIASSFHLIQERRFFIRSAGLVPLGAATRVQKNPVCILQVTYTIAYVASMSLPQPLLHSQSFCLLCVFWRRIHFAPFEHCTEMPVIHRSLLVLCSIPPYNRILKTKNKMIYLKYYYILNSCIRSLF